MSAGAEWGPLAALAGTWEGSGGADLAYANQQGCVAETPYRERMVLNPFGPVENGTQVLYGLDYRTSAWRGDEENPFHTEVGYWLWDAGDGQVMRCFMVPRGCTILAGGPAQAGDTSFVLRAEVGSEVYGILSNPYLAARARTIRYEATVGIDPDGRLRYEELTVIEHQAYGQTLKHTDRNVLTRVEG